MIKGELTAKNRCITIVAAEFNPHVTGALVNGATDAFLFHGGQADNLELIWVPGAFEIPGTVQQILNSSRRTDAIVTLGAVIRGGTPHFDFVAGTAADGLAELSRTADIPVIFGILTTNNLNQALERAGTKAANKGWEVTEAALKMISVYEQIGQ